MKRMPPHLMPWPAAPTRLTGSDVRGTSLFVSFDQPIEALVAGRAPVRHWDNTPSVVSDYATGRDSIVARVTALVDELQRGRKRAP
jgi:hypothetical protein